MTDLLKIMVIEILRNQGPATINWITDTVNKQIAVGEPLYPNREVRSEVFLLEKNGFIRREPMVDGVIKFSWKKGDENV